METARDNYSGRVMDLLTPIGKGHARIDRGRAAHCKTMLLQSIANSITANNRRFPYLSTHRRAPGGMTDMQRSVQRAKSSVRPFDEPASRHVQVAEMVIGKAKRLVEHKKDVASCSIRLHAWPRL